MLWCSLHHAEKDFRIEMPGNSIVKNFHCFKIKPSEVEQSFGVAAASRVSIRDGCSWSIQKIKNLMVAEKLREPLKTKVFATY